jgi:Lon protease-like protein
MSPRLLERFPLFPLALVILPGETVPLHIFEERYKLMIGRCLDDDSEFGIVWLADDGLRDVGCTARVTRVIERLDEGRMNILVRGERPFRLRRRVEDLPYPAGDVELLEDAEAGDEEAARQARERYSELVERVTEERPDQEALVGLDAYGLAATVEFGPEAKQELLELRSERERLDRLGGLLTNALESLERAQLVAERARGNGKFELECPS